MLRREELFLVVVGLLGGVLCVRCGSGGWSDSVDRPDPDLSPKDVRTGKWVFPRGGRSENLIRFGRGEQAEYEVGVPYPAYAPFPPSNKKNNFIRLGRENPRQNNFIRLGRGDEVKEESREDYPVPPN